MEERRFRLDVVCDLEGVSGKEEPDVLDGALRREIEPILEFVRSWAPDWGANVRSLGWIIGELAANGIRAPLARQLQERTGLSYDSLLEAILPNGLDDRFARGYDPSDVEVRQIESTVSCSIPQFRAMGTAGRYRLLGVALPDRMPVVFARAGGGGFEVTVRCPGTPLPAQHRAIVERFEHDKEVRSRVEAMRPRFTRDDRVHLPSFTGGGGLGLLECIRGARAAGLHFGYLTGGPGAGSTTFRISSWPACSAHWLEA